MRTNSVRARGARGRAAATAAAVRKAGLKSIIWEGALAGRKACTVAAVAKRAVSATRVEMGLGVVGPLLLCVGLLVLVLAPRPQMFISCGV
jgi:hypothetical protein